MTGAPWLVGLTGVVILLSAATTAAVRRYGLRAGLLDVPNERSAHSIPVPRGGGLAVVLWSLVAIAGLTAAGIIDRQLGLGLSVGGLLVGGVGWLDDRRGLPSGVRLVVHAVAAVIALWSVGGWPIIHLGSAWEVGPIGAILGVAVIVWCTNLFNFMDGIDGLAGVEAIHVMLWAGIAAYLLGHFSLVAVCLMIGGATAGFLVWNWPPAKIFLGDVGSGFLGYMIGAAAVLSDADGGPSVLHWVTLFGVFVVDATATLIRRLASGDRWDRAHRQHAYQRLAMSGYGHRRVTVGVACINLVVGAAVLLAVSRPALSPWLELAVLGGLVGLYGLVESRWPARFSASHQRATGR